MWTGRAGWSGLFRVRVGRGGACPIEQQKSRQSGDRWHNFARASTAVPRQLLFDF